MNRKKKVEDKSNLIKKEDEKKVASEKVILLLLSPDLFPRPTTWAREWGHSGHAESPLLGPESMDEHYSKSAWRKFKASKKSEHNKSMQPLKSQLTPALTAASAG